MSKVPYIRITISNSIDGMLSICAYGYPVSGPITRTHLHEADPVIIGCLGGHILEGFMQTIRVVAPDAEFEFVIHPEAREALGKEHSARIDAAFTSISIHNFAA